jgi:hypothetical protein
MLLIKPDCIHISISKANTEGTPSSESLGAIGFTVLLVVVQETLVTACYTEHGEHVTSQLRLCENRLNCVRERKDHGAGKTG